MGRLHGADDDVTRAGGASARGGDGQDGVGWQRTDGVAATGRARGTAWEILRASARLGLTAFGGPIAHIGWFRGEYVERRRLLDEDEFAELVGLCQVLPGPSSSQLGVAIGLLGAGPRGAAAAWLGFTLPSAVLMLGFAVLAGGAAPPEGILHGLRLAAVAVVAQAVRTMWRASCRDIRRAGLAVAAAVTLLAWRAPLAQPAVLVAAALLGLALLRGPAAPAPGRLPLRVGRRTGALALAAFALLLAGLPLARAAGGGHAVATAAAFFDAGALVFGGGHVVLPLLQRAVVDARLGVVARLPRRLRRRAGAARSAVHVRRATSARCRGRRRTGSPAGCSRSPRSSRRASCSSSASRRSTRPCARGPRATAALAGVGAAVVGVLAAALWSPVITGAVSRAGGRRRRRRRVRGARAPADAAGARRRRVRDRRRGDRVGRRCAVRSPPDARRATVPAHPGARRRALATVGGGLVLVAVTAALLPFRDHLASGTCALALLAPVLVAAFGGLRTSLVAAVAGALVFNVLFTRPYGSFRIESSEDVSAFVAYAVVAVAFGLVVNRVRATRDVAEQRALSVALLQELTAGTIREPRLEPALRDGLRRVVETLGLDGRRDAHRPARRARARDGRRGRRGGARADGRPLGVDVPGCTTIPIVPPDGPAGAIVVAGPLDMPSRRFVESFAGRARARGGPGDPRAGARAAAQPRGDRPPAHRARAVGLARPADAAHGDPRARGRTSRHGRRRDAPVARRRRRDRGGTARAARREHARPVADRGRRAAPAARAGADRRCSSGRRSTPRCRCPRAPCESRSPTTCPRPVVDETMIRQVLVNLLENAAQHGGAAARRRRARRRAGDALRIAVADHGAGRAGGRARARLRAVRARSGAPAAAAGSGSRSRAAS